MCGRYVREATPGQIAEIFDAALAFDADAASLTMYNIAPAQQAVVVRDRDGRREVAALHWGLVPRWADDPSIGHRMINARGETVASRPAYRDAFRHRRCVVPATGFYEWKKTSRGKQPYLVRPANHALFGFAGLWERWQSPEGSVLATFTIVTTDANAQLRPIHDRMPVILPLDEARRWLAPELDANQLQAMLKPLSNLQLHLAPVSRRVNSPKHDTPECVEPVTSEPDDATLWDSAE